MKSLWRSRYHAQVDRYLLKHFGGAHGVTDLFPYMEADFDWREEPQPLDSRTALKDHNEYHGLERHARQYHATGQYKEAAEHWLIAAVWRREMMSVQDINDKRHVLAVEFALKNYRYNTAIWRWGFVAKRGSGGDFPRPESYGLSSKMLEQKDRIAEAEINAVAVRYGNDPPFPTE